MADALRPAPHDADDILAAWLSPEEACTYLGISRPKLYREVIDHVDARKLGRRLLIKRTSLDDFMARQPRMPKEGEREPAIRRAVLPDRPRRVVRHKKPPLPKISKRP